MDKLNYIEPNASIDRFVDRSFDISDRIFTILERKGISQREFAQMLGKNESQISKWLSGTHNFTIKTITRIETVLNDNVMVILSDSSENISGNFNKGSSIKS